MSDIRIFKLTYTTPTTYGLPQVCINDENNNAEFVDFDEATNSLVIKQNTEIIF